VEDLKVNQVIQPINEKPIHLIRPSKLDVSPLELQSTPLKEFLPSHPTQPTAIVPLKLFSLSNYKKQTQREKRLNINEEDDLIKQLKILSRQDTGDELFVMKKKLLAI